MSGDNEAYSDDSFLEDEPTSSKQEKLEELEERVCSPQSPPFDDAMDKVDWDFKDSFVTALENAGDLSSPPPPEEGGMSTIEEESKSYETSGASNSKNSKRDQEIRELQEFVERATGEVLQKDHHSSTVPASQDMSTYSNQDEGLDALLRKLEKLESAQNVLEEVLNTRVSGDSIDIDAFIAQLPIDTQLVSNQGKNNGDEEASRSFSSEIASIQKLIDGGDLSVSMSSEAVGGNNNLFSPESNPGGSLSGDRGVEDVLKEYEEFERSLSCASVSASNIDESFRSDISSIPQVSTASNTNRVPDRPIPTTLPPKITTSASAVPVIKPPLLKKSVAPPPTPPANVNNPEAEMVVFAEPRPVAPTWSNENSKNTRQQEGQEAHGSRTRPMTSNTHHKQGNSRTSRIESSQSSHGIKSATQPQSQSARATVSAVVTQDSFKPRNRRMRSPRTIASPRHTDDSFASKDIPTSFSARGGGEGYQVSEKKASTSAKNVEAIVAAEALKTIEKLNTMVARQETLLEAYSKDNDKLWGQLRDAQKDSQEKEKSFQDVINSLKTEVATLKVNRLVYPPSPSVPTPSPNNKAELQRLRDDSEVKSQQLLLLRKELLLLQSKLAARPKSPARSKKATAQQVPQEKEKEYQKTITGLNKQVRTLQRILYSKDETAPPPPPQISEGNKARPMHRAKSDISTRSQNVNPKQPQIEQQQRHRGSLRNLGVDASGMLGRKPGIASNKPVNINTGEVLQASLNCIEHEREEFEKIIDDKNKLLFEKEKMILNLRDEVETLKDQLPEGEVVEPGLIDELRSRIITQNKVIQTLKGHLSTFKKLEAENLLLRDEKCSLEEVSQDLRRRLEFAQSLVKPGGEVLCLLSDKVEELNSRYYQRERQLDTLLNRLSVKTTGGAGLISSSSSNDSVDETGGYQRSKNLSPRRRPLDQFGNNNGSLGGPLLLKSSSVRGKDRSTLISADILHMVDLSPSTSFQLFNTVPDLPDM